MKVGEAISKNQVLIRLTSERWRHITTAHPEIEVASFSQILEVIKSPDSLLKGDKGEVLAVKKNGRKY